MSVEREILAFGPVPSRRLGQSLGINNIPPKICTYSCVYCQLGRTISMQMDRREFYNPDEILEEVEYKVSKAKERKEPIDYLTFVPDGEPTLDINMGKEIDMLKKFGIKIAVISNSSFIWKEDVRNELKKSDWVSLKIDTINESIWRKINRAHGLLQHEKILQGIKEFAKSYNGVLVTETMLVQGINDFEAELKNIANFITELKPKKSYIAIPTRPPAERWVQPANEYTINKAYQIFNEKHIDTEYLIGYEGNDFGFTGNVEDDLLSITSVHPMREDAVRKFLSKAHTDWNIIKKLITEKKLLELNYRKNKYYMRKLIDSNLNSYLKE